MRAAQLALAGFFCFTLMDLSIKWLLQFYPLPQVIFLNALFALISLGFWVAPRPRVLYTRRPGLHLVRAVLLLVVDALAFYSYGELPLAEAYTLILTMPLFTAVLGMLFGLERFDGHRVAMVLFGFSGVCVVLSPVFSSFNLALLAALVGALIESFAFLMVTRHKSREHPLAFAVFGMALMAVVAGCWPGWSMADISLFNLLIAAGGGLCYAVATAFVLSAFQKGSPSTVSSMQYSQLLWGMLLGALIWGEWPSVNAWVGGAAIVVSGLLLLRRERNLSRAAAV